MSRKALIRSNFYPYHVVNRTLDQRFYSISKEKLWEIYSEHLCILSWVYGVRIHAFVLMSNHYHLLISTPDENLDDSIRYFQSQVSKRVAEITKSSVYRFESRYKWSIIYNSAHYLSVIRYVYQNPVRAALGKVADYPWSTLHGALGYSRLDIPLSLHDLQAEHFLEPKDMLNFEDWINEAQSEHELTKIRKGLRRYEFQYSLKDIRASSES